MTEPQLSSAQVAAAAGITMASLRRIRCRPGRVPAPDGRFGREPWWWQSTIDRWLVTRDAKKPPFPR